MRVTRTAMAATLTAALFAFGAWYEWGPRHTPPGQTPLTVLTSANVEAFEALFNARPQDARVVLLLSPT